jgi:hypothetical protein
MNPRIGKRASHEKSTPKLKVQIFVEKNTEYSIAIKREFMYIEDAKTAINMAILENRILVRLEFVRWLNSKLPSDLIIRKIDELNDLDHHRLVKLVPNFRFDNI